MQFADMLAEAGLKSGPVYATGILKGYEVARMVADAKAQETIRPMTDAVIAESDAGSVPHMVDRLATYYHSEYVAANQPWILETPFEVWRDQQLARKGMSLNE